MTIDNLKCFLILAKELNYTRAAKSASISQTAMSRKISAIENELSVRLFQRDHHRVELTAVGQEFYAQILPLIEAYDNAVTQVQNISRDLQQCIQIGVGVYEHALLLPVIQDFVDRYPVSRLNCVQYKYRELLDRFVADKLDLILTSDQFLSTVPQDGMTKIPIHNHPWMLALSQYNPLSQHETIDISLLGSQNLITMHEGSVDAVRGFYQEYFPLSSIDYVNSNETKLMLVNSNRGICFIPSFVDVSAYPNLVKRSISPMYRPRKYYAIYHSSTGNPYTLHLAKLLNQYYHPRLWVQEIEHE